MIKKLYYTLYDAECAAMAYTEDHPGTEIARTSWGSYDYKTIDDKSNPDEDSRFTEQVGTWSGETPAIAVKDQKGETIALFGWWDDEID